MQGMNHADMHNMKQNPSAAHRAEGVVNSIDLPHGKINLTHGPIESLKWPGMTMDFAVKDKAILKGIKPAQKVGFEVLQEGPGTVLRQPDHPAEINAVCECRNRRFRLLQTTPEQ